MMGCILFVNWSSTQDKEIESVKREERDKVIIARVKEELRAVETRYANLEAKKQCIKKVESLTKELQELRQSKVICLDVECVF